MYKTQKLRQRQMDVHTCECLNMNMYECMYIHAYIFIYTHSHVCIYTHIIDKERA